MKNISVSSRDTDYSRTNNVQRSIMVLIYILFLLNPLIVQLLEDCLHGYFYVPSEIFAFQKKLPHLEFAQTHLCPLRDINLTPADNKG